MDKTQWRAYFFAAITFPVLLTGCGSETRYMQESGGGTDSADSVTALDGTDTTDTTVDGTDSGTDATDSTVTTDGADGADANESTDGISGTGVFINVSFQVDDSANQTYGPEDGLAWKGSFSYDTDDNLIVFDGAWSGPFIPLWDDGPISDGGHEAEGQQAGDHIWSVSVQMESTTSDVTFEYGAIRNSVEGSDGEWIWQGENGTFTIPANTTDDVDITSLTIDALGWIDIRFSIDVANIDPQFMLDPPQFVEVKTSAWGWSEQTMTDDGTMDDIAGDGIYSLVLGNVTGEGTTLPNNGLLNPGETPEFVFVLDDIEYKIAGVPPAAEGGAICEVNVGGVWVPLTIDNQIDGDRNTYVTVPWAPVLGVLPVNFTVDDTANATYDGTDGLRWKGNFTYEPVKRTISYDDTWSGPFAPLFDDGAWDQGGHEPAGAVAGDNIWGITVWVETNTTETFEYGVVRQPVDGGEDEWIWTGENGTFTVGPDAQSIDTTGLVIAPHGAIDFRLELDTNMLSASFADSTPTVVAVKGSAWAWKVVELNDDGAAGDLTAGDGIYSLVLSQYIGKHDGLLSLGDMPEFMFVLDGLEYKEDELTALAGVSAWSDYLNPGSDACLTKTSDCLDEFVYSDPSKNNNSVITVGSSDQ